MNPSFVWVNSIANRYRLAEACSTARILGVAEALGGRARSFAWISQNRRMSKDYERLCASSKAFIYVAMTRLMVRRLVRAR
jgi:hypothetical protein